MLITSMDKSICASLIPCEILRASARVPSACVRTVKSVVCPTVKGSGSSPCSYPSSFLKERGRCTGQGQTVTCYVVDGGKEGRKYNPCGERRCHENGEEESW